MDPAFDEEEREDLLERGFTNDQIEYLESLEMNLEGLYSDICHIMDDFGDTAEQIIEAYQDANNNPVEETVDSHPGQGGQRRRKIKTRRRKQSKSKRKSRRRKQNKRKTRRRK